MPSWRTTEALTTVRQSADDPRVIEGIALPYSTLSGQVDLDGRGDIGREVHYPGAARSSVDYWMNRQDGARMPFRPRHRERPVGTVQTLEDTPEGVRFRARIRKSPEGDAYLADVADGINGVSIEFGPGSVPDTRMRDGTVVHRDIHLMAIAGSEMPAFDGARVALRDMDTGPEPPPDEAASTEPTDPPEGGSPDPQERNAVSLNTEPVATTPPPAITPPIPEAIVIPPGSTTAPLAPDPVPATPVERDAVVQAAQSSDPVVRDLFERLGVIMQMGGSSRAPATITAQPSVYRRDWSSDQRDRWSGNDGHSYIRDLALARAGDSGAQERQYRHNQHLQDIAVRMERRAANRIAESAGFAERAGDLLQSEIPGALPNDYLPGLLTPRILKGRPMGSFFTRIPISDSRPRIFAKVTTSGSVAVQSAEGAALTATDIATTAVTATPLMYGTYIDISRQVLDSADPNAEGMVMQDLYEAYGQASETVIKTAVEAGASASGTAITAATPYAGVQGNVITYYGTRFKPAQGAFIPSALFSVLLAQNDSTGRPLLPMLGAMNSDGTVSAGGGEAGILGAATKLSYASTANVCVFAVPSDYVIYESSIATFSYDQAAGPQAVRVGLWAYLVVAARLGGLKVTAA